MRKPVGIFLGGIYWPQSVFVAEFQLYRFQLEIFKLKISTLGVAGSDSGTNMNSLADRMRQHTEKKCT